MDPHERREIRALIEGLLCQLSDAEEQLRYEQNVPIASVPAELVCMWFEDHFHPEKDWFKDCFSPQERDTLLAFHRFYEGKLRFLPDTERVTELHQSSHWKEVMDRAGAVLRSIEWAA